MGTRGFTGFVVDGVEKIGYQQYDSYPSGVGLSVLSWLDMTARDTEALGLEGARLRASRLQVVNDDTPITAEAIEKCQPYTNMGVGHRIVDGEIDRSLNWYQLLRDTQGNPEAMLLCGYIEDQHLFPLDSLFCEWGYLIDFDANRFEVYEGFQNHPPTMGRWADRPTAEEQAEDYAAHVQWCKENDRTPWLGPVPEYYAVQLKASWPLTDLPEENAFLDATEGAEEVVG